MSLASLDYACPEPKCTRSFGSAVARDSHNQAVHKGIQRFGCAIFTCREVFDTEQARREHMATTHGRGVAPPAVREARASAALDGQTQVIEEPKGESTMAEFICPEEGCDREFSSAQGRTMHVTRAHRGLGHVGSATAFSDGAKKAKPAASLKAGKAVNEAPPHKLVTVEIDAAHLPVLVASVRDAAPADLDVTDPAALIAEAGRLQLLAALEAASS